MPAVNRYGGTTAMVIIVPQQTKSLGSAVAISTDILYSRDVRLKIARLSIRHSLNPDEIRSLWNVLNISTDYSLDQRVDEELDDILATRNLKLLPPLPAQVIQRVQNAFTTGKLHKTECRPNCLGGSDGYTRYKSQSSTTDYYSST
jgi:hypothetical protein